MDEEDRLVIRVVSSKKLPKKQLREAFSDTPSAVSEYEETTDSIESRRWTYECSFVIDEDRQESYHRLDAFLFYVDRFCKLNSGDAFITSEMIERELPDYGDLEWQHAEINVDYFGLGRWVGMSGFIERFNTQQPKVLDKRRGERITTIRSTFFHDRGYLEVYFRHRVHPEELSPVYKLKLLYSDIEEIVIERELRGVDAFHSVQDRREPMNLFLKYRNISLYKWLDQETSPYTIGFDGEWSRHTKFGSDGDPCTFCDSVASLRVLNLKLEFGEGTTQVIYTFLKRAMRPFVFASVTKTKLPPGVQPVTCDEANSDLRYALACLHSVRPEIAIKIHIDGVYKECQLLLKQYATGDPAKLLNVLHAMYEQAIKNYQPIDFLASLRRLFEKSQSSTNLRSVITQPQMPDCGYLVRKATITPSKFILELPVPVRRSPLIDKCADCLMLVDIRDEDGSQLILDDCQDAHELLKLGIAARISKGFKVVGKTYSHLGSSLDHFNEFGFWAYAPADKKTKNPVEQLLNSLGASGTIAEQMKVFTILSTAYLGQTEIPASWVGEMDDEDNKRGIGRISAEGLRSVLERCGIAVRGHYRAIRVIHNGRVGLLVVDPTMQGEHIVYRKSQKTFESSDNILYVVDVNECQQGILNKLHLSVLSSLHDSTNMIVDGSSLLETFHKILLSSVSDDCDSIAMLKQKLAPLVGGVSVDEVDTSRFDFRRDRFCREMLRCSYLKRMKLLQNLDFAVDGVKNFIPVVDEFGVLAAGETFIRYVDSSGETRVMEGGVLVCKKDSVGVADFQIMRALNSDLVSKALGHLCNVIVLPAKRGGLSPIERFSRSGSYAECGNLTVFMDLDFGKAKIPTVSPVVELLENSRPPATMSEHLLDVYQFLSWNDYDEWIVTSADKEPDGAMSAGCIRTANMRREAVERFMARTLCAPIKNRSGTRPAFLRNYKLYHSSQTPLGLVWEKMRFIDVEHFTKLSSDVTNFADRQDLKIDGCEVYENAAAKDMKLFKEHLQSLAGLYRVSVEELLSGCVFSAPGRRFPTEYESHLEILIKCHMRLLREICGRQFERKMKDRSLAERLKKLSAYVVESTKFPGEGGYCLPWIFPDLLQELLKAPRELKPLKIPRTVIRSKLLMDVPVLTEKEVLIGLKRTIGTMVSDWAIKNRARIFVEEEDCHYFQEELDALVRVAIDAAWSSTQWSEGEEDKVSAVTRDPIPFFACSTRCLFSEVSRRIAATRDSHSKAVMRGIQALLSNTLVRIGARCSFDSFVNVTKIIHSETVIKSIVLPLPPSNNGYTLAVQANRQKYESSLLNSTGCTFLRHVCVLTNSNEAFEEVSAVGDWYSVEYLQYRMLSKNHRLIISKLFPDELGYALRNRTDEVYD